MAKGEAVPGGSQRNASDLIATLQSRAPRLAMAIAAAQLAWPAVRSLHSKTREASTYTVKVPGNDEIYDDLHEWVLGLLPTRDQRALVAWTSRRDAPMAISSSDGRAPSRPTRLRLRYDGTEEQKVMICGHKIKVVVSEPNATEERFKPPEMTFTAYSLDAQQALLAEISKVAVRAQESDRKPLFRMLNRWGDWERLDDLPDRTLDSVILPAGQLERLIADVDRFLSSEQDYLRRCIPWHRGHLYEGEPGTGKTSVARAIATHFGMDIWYLPLADVKKDCDLLSVMNRIAPRSMLLLEDADVFHAATKRDDDDEGVTLSGLLNALDGIATPHGLLTVLTSNDFQALDSAVIRAGRVDLIEHFSVADEDQVSRLLSRWYDRPILTDLSGISPAAVVEVCKRHDDPDDVIAELLNTHGNTKNNHGLPLTSPA